MDRQCCALAVQIEYGDSQTSGEAGNCARSAQDSAHAHIQWKTRDLGTVVAPGKRCWRFCACSDFHPQNLTDPSAAQLAPCNEGSVRALDAELGKTT